MHWPYGQLPIDNVASAATAMVQALDEWLVVQQAVTVEHGRMVVKRLVDHDELQQRVADFISNTLLAPHGLLTALDRRIENRDVPAAPPPLVAQLSKILQKWLANQQQPSSDEEDAGDDEDEDEEEGDDDM